MRACDISKGGCGAECELTRSVGPRNLFFALRSSIGGSCKSGTANDNTFPPIFSSYKGNRSKRK